MTMPADPHAVLRSPGYLKLLVLAAIIGAPIAAAAWGFLWVGGRGAGLALHGPSGRPGLRRRADVVAAAPARARRPAGRADHPVPARQGRRIAGGRVPTRPGRAVAHRAARHLPRGAGRPQPGGGHRARRHRSSLSAAGSASVPCASPRGDAAERGGARGRELQRHQHAVGLAVAGGVPADGGLGAGGTDHGAGAGAGPGGGRRRVARLPRPRLRGRASARSRSAYPDLPAAGTPTLAEFGWAIAIGLAAAVVGTGVRRLALAVRPHVEPRTVMLTPVVGVLIAGLAIVFEEVTDESSSLVLFSGQSDLGPVLDNAASYSVGTLVLLITCKGLAYSLALSAASAAARSSRRCSSAPWAASRSRTSRAGHDLGGGHRHRRHDGDDARTPVHVGATGHPVAGVEAASRGDAARDHRGRGGLRGVRAAQTASGGGRSRTATAEAPSGHRRAIRPSRGDRRITPKHRSGRPRRAGRIGP